MFGIEKLFSIFVYHKIYKEYEKSKMNQRTT